MTLFEVIGKPEEVIFYDGYVIIIEGRKHGVIHNKWINPECGDEMPSLADIQKEFPNANLVIWESYMTGSVYRLGNHESGKWERIGILAGFA